MENKTTTDHDHVTSQEFNKLTSEFAARLEPGGLASKNDIDNLVNEDRYW